MNEFEKVEKLREKANVTYEEAREALNQANGDLLDAMVILEQQGKVKSPEQTMYTTTQEAGAQYADVPAIVRENEKKAEDGFFKKVGRGLKKGLTYVSENFILVTKHEETVIKVPLWLGIILLLAFWELLLVVIIISLFCDCRYQIVGEGHGNEEVNKVMDQAAEFTDHVKDEFDKL